MRPFIMFRKRLSFTLIHAFRLPVVAMLSLMTFEYANIEPSALVMKIWWRQTGEWEKFLIRPIVVKCGKRNRFFILKSFFNFLSISPYRRLKIKKLARVGMRNLDLQVPLAASCNISLSIMYTFIMQFALNVNEEENHFWFNKRAVKGKT